MTLRGARIPFEQLGNPADRRSGVHAVLDAADRIRAEHSKPRGEEICDELDRLDIEDQAAADE